MLSRSIVSFALGASLVIFTGCGPAKTQCDSSTCATGCCDSNGLCQGGATTLSCGSFGSACQTCSTGLTCQLGACVLVGNTGGGSGGGSGGGMGGGTGGGVTGGGTGGGVTGGGTGGGVTGGGTGGGLTGGGIGGGTGGGITGGGIGGGTGGGITGGGIGGGTGGGITGGGIGGGTGGGVVGGGVGGGTGGGGALPCNQICAGCCMGQTCVGAPTVTACGVGGVTCSACNSLSADRCLSGSCSCGFNGPCGPGQRCSGGSCVCDSSTCTGANCCEFDSCVPASVNSCGANGATCTSCNTTTADTCGPVGCQCGSGPACTGGNECLQGTCTAPGGQWNLMSPTSRPLARHRGAMSVVPGADVVLLFGGLSTSSQSSVIADDWIWNGSNNNWSVVSGAAPSARFGHSMAQLPFSNRVVLFGGSTNSFSSLLGDTWIFDSISGWSQLSVTGPIARYEHRMAADTVRGVVVLFGGYGGSAYRNDTWEFNGSSWTNRTPTSGSPSARYAPAMAFDPSRGVTVLFGGYSASLGGMNDTWEWNGTTWTNRTPASGNPAPRDLTAMTYDANRGVMVLFGGSSGNTEEWTWDGQSWTQQTAPRPSGRQGLMMEFDPYNFVPLIFGGIPSASGTPLNDTWMRY